METRLQALKKLNLLTQISSKPASSAAALMGRLNLWFQIADY
jgi:hypothetical protein